MSGPESEGLLAGSKFGVYEIGECVGQGAMGQVYRAEHTLLKRPVALKIMTAAARNSTTGHRRFKREARAAAAIKHPNVVEILDMGVLDGLPFIVMELLEGEDLESYLNRHGKLSEQQIADLALPIIAAIGAVHDAGVVHRDIKPSNIFLARGGREEPLVPKVLDFGISKAAKSLGDTEFVATGPGDLVGTPLYISPEALKGAQYLTAKSDQYSLGVVLYQCAVGRRPHEAKDLARLVRSILSEPIEPPRTLDPSLSPELESAVMRTLRRNPDERFGHVRDLGAALWPLASQRTRHVWSKRFSASLASTLALGGSSAARRVPKRDLRPLWAGLGAALAVLGTGYIVSVTWPARRPEPALRTNAASLAQQPQAGLAAARGSAPELAAPAPVAPEPAAPAPAAAPRVSLLPEALPSLQEPAPSAAGATGAADDAAPGEVRKGPPLPRAIPRRTAAAKAVLARGGRGAQRASTERRATGAEQDETPLPSRRPQAEPERREDAPLPRGANQSPILD